MINAKRSLFMLAACTVLAVTISASTFSAPRVMSAQEEVRQEPLQIEQTETSGVSLAVERVAAAAAEIGREEVTATVSPSNALYDLEWSLTVGDSLIPEADMSDYLTIEEKSATTIELVCHQRFDGYAKLHVEDAYTGKTASAEVSAWTFSDGRESLAQNGDFSTNTTGETSWNMNVGGGSSIAILDNWNFYTESASTTSGSVLIGATGALVGGERVTEGLAAAFTIQSTGYGYLTQTISMDTFTPGSEFNLVVEENVRLNSSYATARIYGEGTDYTLLGSWNVDGKRIFHFSVNDYDGSYLPEPYRLKVFGFGYRVRHQVGSIMDTVIISDLISVELYAA